MLVCVFFLIKNLEIKGIFPTLILASDLKGRVCCGIQCNQPLLRLANI